MRQEIEVKAKVGNLEAVAEKLRSLGCEISEPAIQDDTIFVNYTSAYDEAVSGEGMNFLRIRKSKGKILFTIKQPQSNELDCLEREVEVNDAQEMEEAILLLGYHEAVQVYKIRRKANYNGYEICLDDIRGLGTFVEIEKIAENENAEMVQEELFNFLESLGVKREDRITNGYDTLVYRKTMQEKS